MTAEALRWPTAISRKQPAAERYWCQMRPASVWLAAVAIPLLALGLALPWGVPKFFLIVAWLVLFARAEIIPVPGVQHPVCLTPEDGPWPGETASGAWLYATRRHSGMPLASRAAIYATDGCILLTLAGLAVTAWYRELNAVGFHGILLLWLVWLHHLLLRGLYRNAAAKDPAVAAWREHRS